DDALGAGGAQVRHGAARLGQEARVPAVAAVAPALLLRDATQVPPAPAADEEPAEQVHAAAMGDEEMLVAGEALLRPLPRRGRDDRGARKADPLRLVADVALPVGRVRPAAEVRGALVDGAPQDVADGSLAPAPPARGGPPLLVQALDDGVERGVV